MSNKKGVRVLVTLVIVSILAVSLVSAGFWDLFKRGTDGDLEGELPTTHPKDVQLEILGAPQEPEIVYISDLGYVNPEDGGTVTPADRILTGDSIATKNFEFFVWSIAGTSALPGPGGDPVTDANVLITARDIINAPNRERDSSEAGGLTCAYNRDDVAPTGSIPAYIGQPVRVYRCSVGMYYYDDYGSAVSPNWRVYAYIEDNWAQPEGYRDGAMVNDNLEILPTRLTYFDRLDESKLVPAGGIMDFGTVSYGPQTTQPTDVVGQYPLKIRDTGNSDITPIQVQGEDIPGLTTNTEYVLASWFSMSEASLNPCTGTSLVDGSLLDSGMAQINNGPIAEGDLRVCLTTVQATASIQSYSTTELTNGAPWTIDTTFA